MNGKNNKSESQDQDTNSNVLGATIDVKTAIWILTTVVGVVGTYFATTTRLESRISAAEQYIQSQSPLDVALKQAQIYEQVNALTLVQLEIESLRKQILTISFDFQYGEYEAVPNMQPATLPSGWQRLPIVTGFQNAQWAPTGLSANRLFELAGASSPLTSLNDPTLVSDIHRLQTLVNDFNMAELKASILYPYAAAGLMRPTGSIGIGASQRHVEHWIEMARPPYTTLGEYLQGSLYQRIEEKKANLLRLVSRV